MDKRRIFLSVLLIAALLLTGAAGVYLRIGTARAEALNEAVLERAAPDQAGLEAALAPDAAGTLVLSYSAKVVCTEAMPPGVQFLGANPPIVSQQTDVMIHNQNDFPVTFYVKGVLPEPGGPHAYKNILLPPDAALKLDCQAFYSYVGLTPPGLGIDMLGFFVIQIGPQVVGTATRYASLDVTAEYVRSSEVMKKDIHYQPWWTWWAWGLPWRLGYPYERMLAISPTQQNGAVIDCNQSLANALKLDVAESSLPPDLQQATTEAIEQGLIYHDATARPGMTPATPPALVALIGGCRKITATSGLPGFQAYLDIDYLIVSNKSKLEFDLLGPEWQAPENGVPPWIPGFWYDLPVVTAQNVSLDMDRFFRDWHAERWLDLGVPQVDVNASMPYFFPYWCGMGYWAWWWNAGSCVDIGVGEGESLDVEQITPVRVIMGELPWPPPTP